MCQGTCGSEGPWTEGSLWPGGATPHMQIHGGTWLPSGSRFQHTVSEMDLLLFKRNLTPRDEAENKPASWAPFFNDCWCFLSKGRQRGLCWPLRTCCKKHLYKILDGRKIGKLRSRHETTYNTSSFRKIIKCKQGRPCSSIKCHSTVPSGL